MQSSKKSFHLTRRGFVAAGAMGGAAVAIGCTAARRGNWDFLSDEQARTLGAICDQIVPADEFPSATQVGALNYIDKQLARHYRRHRDTYKNGLEEAESMSMRRFGRSLAALTPQQQFEVVSAIEREQRKFFDLARNHTLEGYYGSPRHGGNRDAISWRMLGLDEPPLRGRAQYDLRKGQSS
jgi:gluconate 2-dehydrogenase gamma chain